MNAHSSHIIYCHPKYQIGGASGKEAFCQYRRHKRRRFDSWVGKIPRGGHGNPLLAWRIPWTEELGGLEFIGLQRDTTEATYRAYLHNDATHTSKISETDPSE